MVHCTDGLDRTGAFILVDIVRSLIDNDAQVSFKVKDSCKSGLGYSSKFRERMILTKHK